MTTHPYSAPVLADDVLYLAADRTVCSKCAGLTALHTSRTVEGAPVRRWDIEDSIAWRQAAHTLGSVVTCDCGLVLIDTAEHVRAYAIAQAAAGPLETKTVALTDLRPGDRLTAIGAIRFTRHRVVAAPLGPIEPGSPVVGVVFEQFPDEIDAGYRFVLYSAEVGTLPLTIQRRTTAGE